MTERMLEMLKGNNDSTEGIVDDLYVKEWKFVPNSSTSDQIGHGLVLCPNEVTMNMAKLALATTVRVKDSDGIVRIPVMREVIDESLTKAAKDNSTHNYTHFFRVPTRLR